MHSDSGTLPLGGIVVFTVKSPIAIACYVGALLSGCAPQREIPLFNEKIEKNRAQEEFSELFHVEFDLDWGYYLSSLDGKESRIWVLFANDQSRGSFHRAFSDETLKTTFGKIILCHCKGRYETKPTGLYFHVTQAEFEYREPKSKKDDSNKEEQTTARARLRTH